MAASKKSVFEELDAAIQADDVNAVLDTSDVLATVDRLPQDFDGATAAAVQDFIGQWLIERNDPRAAEAHARAIRLLAGLAEPDLELLYAQVEALTSLAERQGDLRNAVFLQRQLVALIRAHDEEESARLVPTLERLKALIDDERKALTAEGSSVPRDLELESEVVARKLDEFTRRREVRREERMGLEQQRFSDRKTATEPERTTHHDLCEVLFCTSRRLNKGADSFGLFSGEPQEGRPGFDGHYGIAQVLVPKRRDVGQSLLAHRSWIRDYVPWEGAGRYRYLLDDVLVYPTQGWEDLARRIAKGRRESGPHGERPEALIYVHGYNTRFHEAMERAAQLGSDLDIAGPVAAYSWPSAGSVQSYFRDVLHKNPVSASHLVSFINRVSAAAAASGRGKAERPAITLIAHSLGCRLVADALMQIANGNNGLRAADGSPIFSQVIFASAAEILAPDLIDVIARTASLADRFCVYCSDRDKALAWRSLRLLKGIIADKPMAGADRLVLARHVAQHGLSEKVDVIETSAVANFEYGLKGHNDYATSAIDDLRMQLWISNRAAERAILLERPPEGNDLHWQVRKLDDFTPTRMVNNPFYLTKRTVVRRALEAVRGQRGVKAAIMHHKAACDSLIVAGRRGADEANFHERILDVLRQMPGAAQNAAMAG